MNRAQIRTLVESTTGRTDKTTLINSAVNVALSTISAVRLWHDLRVEGSGTMTSGTNSLSLATGGRRYVRFRVMDGLNSYPIKIRPKSWITAHWPDPTALADGKPYLGYIYSNTLYTVPPPDDDYDVYYDYYRTHPDLDSDDDTVLIPQADEAVVAYTTYYVLKALMRHDDAQHWLNDYLTQLALAIEMDHSPAIEEIAEQREMTGGWNENYRDMPFIKETP